MARRVVLGAGALIVVGLVIALILFLRTPVTPSRPGVVDAGPHRVARPPISRPVVSAARIALDGGVGDDTPLPEHAISSMTVMTIRQAVDHFVVMCGDGLRKRGDVPSVRLNANVEVRVRNGRARFKTVTIEGGQDLPPDVVQCVYRALARLDADAPDGQADAEERIQMPFLVP